MKRDADYCFSGSLRCCDSVKDFLGADEGKRDLFFREISALLGIRLLFLVNFARYFIDFLGNYAILIYLVRGVTIYFRR